MKVRSAVSGVCGAAMMAALVSPLAAQDAPPPSPTGPVSRVSGDTRLFMRFAQDAAVVSSYWLEGQAFLETGQPPYDAGSGAGDEAELTGASAIFAMNVAEDFEFGGRLGFLHRDPDRASSESGLGDMDIWGKVRIVTDPVQIALGIDVSLPTGDSDKFLGSGETNVGFFGAVRKDFSWVTLAGNLGLRINQDPDFDNVTLEGKNSVLIGVGALFPVGKDFVLNAEWSQESERYDGLKTDSRLLGGVQYRRGSGLTWRGAIATGLSDGAPDTEVRGSVVWIF